MISLSPDMCKSALRSCLAGGQPTLQEGRCEIDANVSVPKIRITLDSYWYVLRLEFANLSQDARLCAEANDDLWYAQEE